MSIDRLFFELLQIAIGNRDTLSVTPTKEQWAELFLLSKKQALMAVAFRGISKLRESGHRESDGVLARDLESTLYFKWLGLAAKVAQRNKELSVACAALCKDLALEGLYSCILKGQSNLINYPEDLQDCRTPGDIDVWCDVMDPEGIDVAMVDTDGKGAHYEKYKGHRGVIEWVLADLRMKGEPMPEVLYHHVDWCYNGIECEVHFRPSWMNNPIYNIRLQKWCADNEQWLDSEYEGYNVPSVGFNAVYQLVHIYRHLFNEGIGLRQLLDYYFVLKTLNSSYERFVLETSMGFWDEGLVAKAKSKVEVIQTLSSFGMKPFASAVMWVLQEVFEMPSEYLLCPPDERRGRFLLNEIMYAGNFGKYDERNMYSASEGFVSRFIRRQKRFSRFLSQYPSEVIWGPYFSIKQRLWRLSHGWR